jgi:uncharacterized protein (DUF488 family)
MLTRQKVILKLLHYAGRPVSKLELMKWAFILAHETASGGIGAFYEFLPYHYGPFSFALQRDLDTFTKSHIIIASDRDWESASTTEFQNLPNMLESEVRNVANRFRHWSPNDIMNYFYSTYPAYTVNSKRERLACRRIADPAIYTTGYEGLQIDGFLDRLIQVGIYRLIDVRNNPVARRYGFHKSTLQRLCGYLDIEYFHFPELGIVSSERQQLDSEKDYTELFRRYESTTLAQQPVATARVAEMMREKSSVLVCMEAEACRCHRSRLAEAVARLTDMEIVNLGAQP